MAEKKFWNPRYPDRYFENYENRVVLDERGHRQTKLVYVGDWYGLRLDKAGCRKLKLRCAVLTGVLTALFLLLNFFPGEIGMSSLVGCPFLLALLPMFYFWMGLITFLRAGQEWEIQQYRGGYRRMDRAAVGVLILLGLTLIFEVVYLIQNGAAAAQLYQPLGVVVCFVLCGALCLLLRRNPALVVRKAQNETGLRAEDS